MINCHWKDVWSLQNCRELKRIKVKRIHSLHLLVKPNYFTSHIRCSRVFLDQRIGGRNAWHTQSRHLKCIWRDRRCRPCNLHNHSFLQLKDIEVREFLKPLASLIHMHHHTFMSCAHWLTFLEILLLYFVHQFVKIIDRFFIIWTVIVFGICTAKTTLIVRNFLDSNISNVVTTLTFSSMFARKNLWTSLIIGNSRSSDASNLRSGWSSSLTSWCYVRGSWRARLQLSLEWVSLDN